jgi:uncharacterized protein with GYD domain
MAGNNGFERFSVQYWRLGKFDFAIVQHFPDQASARRFQRELIDQGWAAHLYLM